MKRLQIAALAGTACLFTVGIAGQASAEAHEEIEAELATVEMSAGDVVRARRAAYWMSTQAVGQIKAGIEEGGDLNRTRFAARLLVNWAEALPGMFPEGTDLEGSKALPTVWSDRQGFEAAARAYRNAAQNVADTAETGDREATNAAFMEMAGTCHACHTAYRR